MLPPGNPIFPRSLGLTEGQSPQQIPTFPTMLSQSSNPCEETSLFPPRLPKTRPSQAGEHTGPHLNHISLTAKEDFEMQHEGLGDGWGVLPLCS